jgi:hypothetical protein
MALHMWGLARIQDGPLALIGAYVALVAPFGLLLPWLPGANWWWFVFVGDASLLRLFLEALVFLRPWQAP